MTESEDCVVMVFDTETTGLPPRKTVEIHDADGWKNCRIVQIAWSIYRNRELVSSFTCIIKPDNFSVPSYVAAIHGITTEHAYEHGIDIHDMFAELQTHLPEINKVVAHNIVFDDKVLLSECYRYGYTDIIEQWVQKDKICTMKMGKEHMQAKKWPKLCELYQALFSSPPEGRLHTADVDVSICADCYFRMTDNV
jgi:DNA polymerase III epsilon subunit-like protein